MKRTREWKTRHRAWYRGGRIYFSRVGSVDEFPVMSFVTYKEQLDAIDVLVVPHWGTSGKDVGLGSKNLYTRPGRFIPVNGAPE